MGMYRTFQVVLGVPVDVESWFESYEAEPLSWEWCDHKEEFKEDMNFCPFCGKKRPEPQIEQRLDPEKVPAFVNDENLTEPFDWYPRPSFLVDETFNGLTMCSNTACEGNEDDEDVFYLGEVLSTGWGAGSYTEFLGELDGDLLKQKMDKIRQKAREIGVKEEPSLAWFSWYG